MYADDLILYTSATTASEITATLNNTDTMLVHCKQDNIFSTFIRKGIQQA
jgi:hypothetical protein